MMHHCWAASAAYPDQSKPVQPLQTELAFPQPSGTSAPQCSLPLNAPPCAASEASQRTASQAAAAARQFLARGAPARSGRTSSLRASSAGAQAGRTPLHSACQGNVRELCTLLLEAGADAGAADRDGITPMRAALEAGHIHCVTSLVR